MQQVVYWTTVLPFIQPSMSISVTDQGIIFLIASLQEFGCRVCAQSALCVWVDDDTWEYPHRGLPLWRGGGAYAPM